jgi:hypothetical protein
VRSGREAAEARPNSLLAVRLPGGNSNRRSHRFMSVMRFRSTLSNQLLRLFPGSALGGNVGRGRPRLGDYARDAEARDP